MTMNLRTIVAAMLLLIAPIAARQSAAQSVTGDGEITQVKGNLYRLRVGDQHTVFLVTRDGVVLVDPLSLETAYWLQDELAIRFPPSRVRYVVHTSHRFDRAEGSSVFVESAEIVGHRDFNSGLSSARRSGPESIAISDRVRAKDRNGDGRVTSEELYRRVRDVETYFDTRRSLVLGGVTVALAHAPSPLAPENAIVNFVSERIAFAAEAPPLDASPFTFGTWKPALVREWLSAVAALEFDTLVLADGTSVPKARISRLSAYVNDLVARVIEDYERGGSAATFDEAKLPQAYRSDSTFREWRANASDVFRNVSVFRVDATVGGLGHYTIRDGGYCDGADTCSMGGMVPALTGSLSLGAARWAAVGEFSNSRESFTGFTSRFVDEDFALVETRASLMMRHNRPAGAMSLRVLGGLSYTVGNRSGVRRIKEGLAPFAGRRPFHSETRRWGYTGGIDLVFGQRIGIVLPLRFNYARRDSSGTFPHRMDAQAGVAITLRLRRSIN
jgi:hypothetical protein